MTKGEPTRIISILACPPLAAASILLVSQTETGQPGGYFLRQLAGDILSRRLVRI